MTISLERAVLRGKLSEAELNLTVLRLRIDIERFKKELD